MYTVYFTDGSAVKIKGSLTESNDMFYISGSLFPKHLVKWIKLENDK